MDANILIVDDEEIVRRSYATTLAAAHCRATAACDGEEALRAMEREPFDVVLLDLRMPGEGGMGVLKKMKQRWPEREVVIITGYPSVDSAKEAVRLGAYDYIAKPVGPDEILQVANGAWQRKQFALRGAAREDQPFPPHPVVQ
ncbi:MAG TPA: response regulator [Usitatibacter sp.]|nr:response regulator [Usitatibacter sp.]